LIDVFSLVPKDKSDTSGLELLKTIEIEKVEPILYQLLEWLQDLNWPVAEALIEVLPRFHSGLVAHIRTVFNSDDEIWKCWALRLIEDFPPETVTKLESDIKRIAECPTTGELNEEVAEYARDLICKFNL
jgi:hypothetical protein